MSNLREKISGRAHGGVKISLFNTVLIILGLCLSVGMIITTFRTEEEFHSVISASENYMDSQQATGMLDSLSAGMAADCRAFLEDGDPSHVHSFSGQLDALNEQLAISDASRAKRDTTEADLHLDRALAASREMTETELRAMRLMAETLPVPLAAYPELLQQTALSAEDQALSPDEKKETANALMTSESFIAAMSLMDTEISDNHRLNSQISQRELSEGESVMKQVVSRQKITAFLFILFAVIALIANHLLIVRPIQRSVRNLDRREEIPLRGSYEVRHMAEAYNKLLVENNRKQEALAYTATHDALTDVLNRGAFEEIYHSDEAARYGGLIIADVDHFKYYNDSHGHDTGDRVLEAVATAIRDHVRKTDLVFRIGGDEFVVLLKDVTDESGDRILQIVRDVNQKLSSGAGGVPTLTISAGIAFRDDLKEGEDLFKCADIALLKVKENGRCGSMIYSA